MWKIALDYPRKGSVLLLMENSTAPLHTDTLASIFELLTQELECALDAVSSLDAPKRMTEILQHCIKAAVLAKTGEIIVARSANA
jgi:hypothetical protein